MNKTKPISMTSVPTKRCAVYCRVSSDERLDQSFNSIDAQREAGLAYISSQRAEGWVAVSDTYEDPGFSGGNMARPGLKRLLQDIQAGLIDIVVVYKIDRLSRSLADFARMVDVFDQHQASFSSVTQQINSATSMGRLMLNVLLSFAQFEREVTGERIRDKIAASKRKGLWMGGPVPLGYRVHERQLLIDEAQATTVRWIFKRYVESESTTQMVKELRERGMTSKTGKPFAKTALYKILHNRVYLGEIKHKGEHFAGAHEALISQELWDQAHALMARDMRNRVRPDFNDSVKSQYLLRGMLFSEDGDLYLPMTARKANGKIYRYYVLNRKANSGATVCDTPNQAANVVEPAVIDQVLSVLRSGAMVSQYWAQIQKLNPDIEEPEAVVWLMRQTAKLWDSYFPPIQQTIVRSLIECVTVEDDGLRIHWRFDEWPRLLQSMQPDTAGHEIDQMELA